MNAPLAMVVHVATVMVATPAGTQRRCYVIEAPTARDVDAEILLDKDEAAVRVDILPAVRLEFMPQELRCRYTAEYMTLLLYQAAQRLGVPLAEMKGWVHYDPIDMDERVRRWVSPGVRYTGD